MKKTFGTIAALALGLGLSLQASAQGPAGGHSETSNATKSECEQRADSRNFGSHGDRHWFVLRCLTSSR